MQQTIKKRGTILVDTSVLIHLLKESDSNFLTPEQKGGDTKDRYSDALIFLANHGYEIVIPAMVAYETARMLPSGQYEGEYFGRTATGRFTDAHSALLPIKNKKVPHTSIAMPLPCNMGNSSDADHFLTQAGLAERPTRDSSIRAELIALGRAYKSGLGNIAAEDWISRIKESNLTQPLFYLSNDRKATESVYIAASKRNIQCGKLSLLAFYRALERHGLFKEIGISDTKTPNSILNEMHDKDGVRRIDRPVKRMSSVFIDSSLPEHKCNFLFSESLHGIREEIESARAAIPEPPPSEPSSPPLQSQADKFMKKWGDRYKPPEASQRF